MDMSLLLLITADRRVSYAISFLTGLRLGEVAGTCWRHWQTAEVGSKLVVAHSYRAATDTPNSTR